MSVSEFREWAIFLSIEDQPIQQSPDEMIAMFRGAFADRIVKKPN